MAFVLVAEDDPQVRALVGRILGRAGHSVDEVDNGKAALGHARGELPDIVILDWMMPGMSGVEVCEALRADPYTAELPIIMLSGRNSDADVMCGRVRGADAYVPKPFTPQALLAEVDAVLYRSRIG